MFLKDFRKPPKKRIYLRPSLEGASLLASIGYRTVHRMYSETYNPETYNPETFNPDNISLIW